MPDIGLAIASGSRSGESGSSGTLVVARVSSGSGSPAPAGGSDGVTSTWTGSDDSTAIGRGLERGISPAARKTPSPALTRPAQITMADASLTGPAGTPGSMPQSRSTI